MMISLKQLSIIRPLKTFSRRKKRKKRMRRKRKVNRALVMVKVIAKRMENRTPQQTSLWNLLISG